MATQDYPDDNLTVDDHITLCSAHERYTEDLYQLVVANQAWLQKSMDWPGSVNGPDDIRRTLAGNHLLHHKGFAKMYLVKYQDQLVGVVSFNQIEPTNKVGYIGYWLAEDRQGQGILSRALEKMIAHWASQKLLRRFVIKCIVENRASNRMAERCGFTLEGRMKQAEFLNGHYYDQHLWARIIPD